jgi:hypothetical protein
VIGIAGAFRGFIFRAAFLSALFVDGASGDFFGAVS